MKEAELKAELLKRRKSLKEELRTVEAEYESILGSTARDYLRMSALKTGRLREVEHLLFTVFGWAGDGE
jgi:hypothetical protein